MMGALSIFLKKTFFFSRSVKVGRRFHVGILSFVSSPTQLIIGDDVYIGKFCSIQCSGIIGNGVLIANNVGIIGRKDHDMRAIGVTVRRSPWVGDCLELARDPKNQVVIEDDVWVGFGAIILSGVKIGKGAVIGAGAVVTNDVEPYTIVAGNPCQIVGRRFSAEQAILHEKHIAG